MKYMMEPIITTTTMAIIFFLDNFEPFEELPEFEVDLPLYSKVP